jgi:hypothetical protein
VAKSGPGLGGGVAAPTKNHFVIRGSEFDIRFYFYTKTGRKK